MGRWTYYSPFILGILLVLGMNQVVLDHPRVAAMSDAGRWTMLGVACLLIGLLFQLAMIGAQGALAQVLPVPGGRSIRGRPAVVAGGLIVLWVAFGAAAAFLQNEDFSLAATIVAGLSLLAGVVALLMYIWQWPTAARDFDTSAR